MIDDTYEDAPSADEAGRARSAAHLFVVLECDRPLAAGARYSLDQVDEIIIGRGEARSALRTAQGGIRRLRVSVPGRSMSSTHARIRRSSRGFVVEDAGSTNGTFVNGSRVSQAELRDADVLELGHTIFLLRSSLPTPEASPMDDDWERAPAVHAELATLLPSLAAEFALAASLARSQVPMILLGETGTGKERLARAVHRISKRSGAFVAVNCGALPPNLVESQLFGYVKGAFSGAARDELGFLRAANGGTLLLDEVDELPPGAQVALLRVLQEQEVTPVGSARSIPIDVRIVAATHGVLSERSGRGAFRADLYARLAGSTHVLPPLRARIEDLGIILAEVLGAANARVRLRAGLGVRLMLHPWPHNIREVVQRFKRGLALSQDGVLSESHLGFDQLGSGPPPPERERERDPGEAQLERELVRTLRACEGNVSEAARRMGKARMQIQRWMRRFGIDATRFRAGPSA